MPEQARTPGLSKRQERQPHQRQERRSPACPLGRKATAVTGAACSANVTKQKPLASVQTLTCAPAGEGEGVTTGRHERSFLACHPRCVRGCQLA